MDTLISMKVFARVVEASSFAGAAKRLDMTSAMVTRHVANLEAKLGARLLNRNTRGLSLTEPGSAYYERCAQILEQIDEAENVATQATAKPTGVLRMSAPVSFGVHHLTPVLPEFLAAHPEIRLDVELNDRLVDLVGDGFDLAIRIGRQIQPSLIARRIAPAKMIICASPAYLARHGEPRTAQELERHNCLTYSYLAREEEWRFPHDGSDVFVRVDGSIRANNGDMLCVAAAAGVGIVMLPTFIAGEHVRAGRLQRILTDYALPELGVFAVYPSRRHLSLKVRTFIDFLVSRWGDRPAWDD